MRPGLPAATAVAALLLLPATASAGSVTLDGGRLEISAGAGKNVLLVKQAEGRIRIEELNEQNGLRPRGSGCARASGGDGTRVECPASGIRKIRVITRGGSDWVVVGRFLPDFRGNRLGCIGADVGARLDARLGDGRDVAELSEDEDMVRGGRDHDLLMGCGGDDRIVGGDNGDDVSGDRGDDELRGGAGSDDVIGCKFDPDDVNYPRDEPGADHLRGGEGSDFLYGCDGVDAFEAGSGDDYLNTLDEQPEVVDCGEGSDVIYRDPQDSGPTCEVTTHCTTDNFPIGPETGVPECFGAEPPAFTRRSRTFG